MISSLFTELSNIIDAFGTMLGNLFAEVIGLIYTPGVGDAAGSFTDFGTIVLISIGTGLLIWGLTFIMKFLKIKR